MAKLELKGNTPEEKLEHVQKILKHWQRKTRKAIVGVMPPIPFLSYIENPSDDGTVIKAVLPAAGKIIRLVIRAKINRKDPVGFQCVLTNMGGSSFSFPIQVGRGTVIEDISENVGVGDILVIKIPNPKNDSGEWLAEQIFISLLYEISIKDSTKAQYMIENLERLLEKEDEGI